ncbi:hypothetical protein [Actinoplanes rectilineatus]|uniref:hypothetical protein n=1 Tax=Actinoplanes rectilineatus TaxID=113571 RepID=UPI0005F2EC8A|nr:hypothetical protein [Actinoplanes rectilineatus]
MSDLGVGDADQPWIVVAPAAIDTVVTLTAVFPGAPAVPVPVAAGPLVQVPGSSPAEYTQRWQAVDPIVYPLPGRTVLHWQTTGTGEGTEDVEVWVTAPPAAGGPTWSPGLSRVAAYVPRLTVDQTTPGSAIELGTFDQRTNPTGDVAQRHINDAVAEVQALAGTVPDSLHPLASAIAARRAAAMILRAYGDDRTGQDSLATAAALEARADKDLDRLQAAIRDLEDGDADGSFEVLPIYSFPAAVPWGDRYLY